MFKLKLLILFFLLILISCMPRFKQSEETAAPTICVLLKQITTIDSITFNGVYNLQSEEACYEFGKKNKRIYIKALDNGFKIFNENRIFTFRDNESVLFFTDRSQSSFTCGGKSYSGGVILAGLSKGSVYIINKVDLETYLKGVVPAEMPGNKASRLNALKAQAICARTYALKRIEDNSKNKFDLYADTRDQVYGGLNLRKALSDKAVNQTHGTVIMYNDTLASVFYHSSCGGILEAAENVWQNISKPYLTSRQDALGDVFSCAGSPNFRWKEYRTIKQIDSLFSNQFKKSYLKQIVQDTTDLFLKVNVLERTSSGRVSKMNISYGDTTFTLTNYEIRRFFSKKGKGLPSALFSISAKDDSVLVFDGAGFGHGVGLCQWGAINMSEKGFKYYHILNKYFRGTYLKKAY